MTKLNAGMHAKKGYYFSTKTWTLRPIARDGEALPGEAGETYLHIPLLLAFAVAPLMGAAFLMFLPFVGFYLAIGAALRPVVGLLRRSATEIAASMAPAWIPGEAHLTGQPAGEAGIAGPPEDGLAELEREIAARRRRS